MEEDGPASALVDACEGPASALAERDAGMEARVLRRLLGCVGSSVSLLRGLEARAVDCAPALPMMARMALEKLEKKLSFRVPPSDDGTSAAASPSRALPLPFSPTWLWWMFCSSTRARCQSSSIAACLSFSCWISDACLASSVCSLPDVSDCARRTCSSSALTRARNRAFSAPSCCASGFTR